MAFFNVFIAVLCSAAVFILAIPNEFFHYGLHGAGLFCLMPLYYVLVQCNSRKQSALIYAFMVCAVHLFSSFWLINFQDFAIFTLGASTVAYFFLALPFGLFFYYALKLDIRYRCFAFALVWTLWEVFKSSGFLAYPWGTIIMTAVNFKYFIQFIDVTGAWGLSFVLPLISAVSAEIIMAITGVSCGFSKEKGYPFARTAGFTAALLILLNLYGYFVLKNPIEPITSLKLGLIQQNSDSWNDNLEDSLLTGQRLTRELISTSPSKPDLIVWSETSLSVPYITQKYYYEYRPDKDPFMDFLKEIQVPVLVGTPIQNEEDFSKTYNGLCLIQPSGEVTGTYAKIQLVPFAEFMPFIDSPIVQKLFDSLVGFSSGWEPGPVYKTLNINNSEGKNIKFAAPICYEDAFPSLSAHLHSRGSNLFINLTNDSWSKTVSAEYQHFAVAFFRAIEFRTCLVRSTNSGYTCVIDPYGKVIADLPLFKEAFLYADVPIYPHQSTPFAVFKNWLPFVFFIIFMKIMWSFQTVFVKKEDIPIYIGRHWKEDTSLKLKRRVYRQKKLFPYRRVHLMRKKVKKEHSSTV